VYRGGFLNVVSVTAAQTFGGNLYYQVEGLGDFRRTSVWLRRNAGGDYLAYDPAAGQETPWLTFSAADGSLSPASVHGCNPFSTVVSRSQSGQFLLGTFSNLTEVHYAPGGCADAGLESEQWLPYIGLLQRTEQSIAGPRVSTLVYARINGVTMVSAPETSFSIALDNTFYAPACTAPVVARVRLTLRQTIGGSFQLTFPTGADFDLVLRDSQGKELTRWSRDKAFTQIIRNVEVAGERNWTGDLPLTGADGRPLSTPGAYTIEGFLVNADPPQYRAQAPFRIPAAATACP
jgi:hypothetical protein